METWLELGPSVMLGLWYRSPWHGVGRSLAGWKPTKVRQRPDVRESGCSFLAAADRSAHSDRAGSKVHRRATRLISAISNHTWPSSHVLG